MGPRQGQTATENILTGNPEHQGGLRHQRQHGARRRRGAQGGRQACRTVIVVGFDANPNAAAAVLAGDMAATVAQAPEEHGRLRRRERAAKLKKGETIEP